MKCLRATLFLCSVAALIPPLLFAGLYVHHAAHLPRLASIDTYFDQLKVPSTLYSAEGIVIGEYFEERREIVPLERMPIALIQAFLAAEDERFFEHDGVDAKGVLRAAWANVSAGRIVEGASTITQQLAKTMLGRQKTFDRKFREAILARRMESIYTKKDILTLYLNQIFLGHNSYGVQAAAQNYFRKDVSELELGEMTTLAVLPPSPSRINPIRNLKKTMLRRKHVLNRMAGLGYITAGQAEQAKQHQPTVYPLKDAFYERMPHVTEAARKQVQTRYARGNTDKGATSNWLKHGLKIFTTAELALQQTAQATVYDELAALDRKYGYRGPLRQIPVDEFEEALERATAYYLSRGMIADGQLQPNNTFLGFVRSVTANEVRLGVTDSINSTLKRKQMRWAGAYREYPVKQGKRNDKARVSWRPRLKDCRTAFKEGDVVAVYTKADGSIHLTQPPKVQGAVLNWEPDTGYVRAMVGGSDFELSEVNRIHSLRQTASTMKPIYYSLAYATGLKPSDGISDAPYGVRGVFESDGGSSDGGAMAAWLGLVKSRNSVSGRVGDHVRNHAGLPSLQQWGKALGLTHPLKGNKAEVFGGDQTPFDMSTAFGTFQNKGLFTRPQLIRKVVDKDKNVVVDHSFPGDSTLSLRDSASLCFAMPIRARGRS